jgi:hypothetical protein
MGLPWMLCVVVFVLCRPEKRRRERVGVGSRGKYPGAPPHHRKNEEKKTHRKRYLIAFISSLRNKSLLEFGYIF